MTTEKTKELIAEAQERIAAMQAYVEGKQIQYLDEKEEAWNDIATPSWSQKTRYRIKPQSKFRPFENTEECWQEMQKHQPFGWLKDKEDGHYSMVTAVGIDEKYCLAISGNNGWPFDETMRDYTFADGAPFGILTEEEENPR